MSATRHSARSIGVLAASLAIALLPAAPAAAASSVGVGSHSTTADVTLATEHYPITLSEMKIATGYDYVPAGPVTFDVTNVGAETHEVVFIKTDAAPGALPIDPTDKSRVLETGSAGETGDVDAGKTVSVTLNLAPGRYQLICNQPGHYAAGMYTELTVATFFPITLADPMKMELPATTIPAGPVVVEAQNTGAVMHEAVFIKTTQAANALPLDPNDPTKINESLSVGEVGDIDAGRFSGNEIDLTPGTYVVVCDEPGHYAAGMWAVLIVQ